MNFTKTLLCVMIISLLLAVACAKDKSVQDTSPIQKDTIGNTLPPLLSTNPKYDATSAGIYKGIIVGSSGYIVFRIFNNDTIVRGYVTIDGKADVLFPTSTITPGAAINNVLFKGTFSSVRLSADANGENVSLSDINIDGHNHVESIVYHDKSSAKILCYEGVLTGIDNPKWNGTLNALLIYRNDPKNYDSVFVKCKIIMKEDTIYQGNAENYFNKPGLLDTLTGSLWQVNPDNKRSYRFYFAGKEGLRTDTLPTHAFLFDEQDRRNSKKVGSIVFKRVY